MFVPIKLPQSNTAADILLHLLSLGASSIKITAAFIRECSGHLYVEAISPEIVRRSLAGVSAFVRWREGILLVPIQERVELLGKSGFNRLTSDWVRVKRGLYRHDLGYVLRHENFSSKITFALVPRLSYNPYSANPKAGTKRQAAPTGTRPSKALLDLDRARQIDKVESSRSHNDYLKFQGKHFRGGLLIRQHSGHDLITKNVTPRYEEIQFFRASPCVGLSVIRKWQIADSLATLQAGNRVEILTGELKGSLAVVDDIQDNISNVRPLNLSGDTGIGHETLQLPIKHVRKAFLPGDFVQVRHGVDAGNRGYVTTTSEPAGGPMVTFYRHDSLLKHIPSVSLPFGSPIKMEDAYRIFLQHSMRPFRSDFLPISNLSS